ncbi:LCP family protein [Fervidicella metallireducens]|uniref:LCP family protein n=1 Tax=Fervidicella metallireducens TaxID=655338 RepID=UPI0005574519|nr:LCP family protein [Fervidicella metallireducens]
MKKRYIYFLIPLILVIVTVFGGYYYINSKIYKPLNNTSDDISNDKRKLNLKEEQGIINILLVGVDARGNYEDARTDSIILLTINTNTKKIKLTSFMRDMYVPIPDHQDSRINTSFFLGGVELLLKTINQDFNLNIQNYISVDFHAFQDIVDKLGGIDVEVKDYEVKEINKYIKEVNGNKSTLLSGPGMQHLNGQQALSYCRIRKVATVIMRELKDRGRYFPY